MGNITYTQNNTTRIVSEQRLMRMIKDGKLTMLLNPNYHYNPGCKRILAYQCTCNLCSRIRIESILS